MDTLVVTVVLQLLDVLGLGLGDTLELPLGERDKDFVSEKLLLIDRLMLVLTVSEADADRDVVKVRLPDASDVNDTVLLKLRLWLTL